MNNNEIKEQLIVAREEYINSIKAELLGPGSEFSVPDAENELISSTPLSRYSVGILYPQGNLVSQDSDETVPITENESANDETDAEELPTAESGTSESSRTTNRNYEFDETADENLDEEIGLSSQYMPSSMGLTFIVKGDVTKVRGNVSFATYRSAKIPDCIVPYAPYDPDNYAIPPELSHIIAFDKDINALRLLSAIQMKEVRDIFEKDTIPENEHFILKQAAYRFVDFYKNGYVRVPHNTDFILDFSENDYIDRNRELHGTTAKITALRTKISNGLWSVTVMLVNDMAEIPAKAHHCIFQSVLNIFTDGNNFRFVENNPNSDFSEMDDEERSLELLYRKKKIYATGLGVSSDWDIDTEGLGSVWSDFFPKLKFRL